MHEVKVGTLNHDWMGSHESPSASAPTQWWYNNIWIQIGRILLLVPRDPSFTKLILSFQNADILLFSHVMARVSLSWEQEEGAMCDTDSDISDDTGLWLVSEPHSWPLIGWWRWHCLASGHPHMGITSLASWDGPGPAHCCLSIAVNTRVNIAFQPELTGGHEVRWTDWPG